MVAVGDDGGSDDGGLGRLSDTFDVEDKDEQFRNPLAAALSPMSARPLSKTHTAPAHRRARWFTRHY